MIRGSTSVTQRNYNSRFYELCGRCYCYCYCHIDAARGYLSADAYTKIRYSFYVRKIEVGELIY